jgi:3-methyladenine DNA glycosylase AlkD
MPLSRDLVRFVQRSFSQLADPAKAGPMAAYMKTEMPFYGVQQPQRIAIYREMKKHFTPADRTQYEDAILALWKLPHREERYAALEYACHFTAFITIDSVPLYEQLIREGAWWDLVDVVATALAGSVLLSYRRDFKPTVEKWIDDEDLWIRRTALLCHNRHKKHTDRNQLFDHCLRRADEKEFFIRKAIGWALREYSYAEPELVRKFLFTNQQKLSTLSFKEGAKQLVRTGMMRLR